MEINYPTTESIKNYAITELYAISSTDRHAVRDEALRRHALVAARFLKAKKEMESLDLLLKEVM